MIARLCRFQLWALAFWIAWLSTDLAAQPVRPTGDKPLTRAEFDAVALETKRRARHEDPTARNWVVLDKGKLDRMLSMPEFAALDDESKKVLVNQAGEWELMPFDRPSIALAMIARWYPEKNYDKPVNPEDSRVTLFPRFSLFNTGANWGSEAGAMAALLQCFPPPAWVVRHEEPMLWTMAHGGMWDIPNVFDFGACVRKQKETLSSINPGAPDTARGKSSAAILEKKLGRYLLNHGCTGKGPDSCLPLLHALVSLNPRNSQLIPILEKLAPEFEIPGGIRIPVEWQENKGELDAETSATAQDLRRTILRKVIFLTAKLRVVLASRNTYPKGELEKSVRASLELAIALDRLDKIQAYRGSLKIGDGRDFADPWKTLAKQADETPELARLLDKLGREYARSDGCDLYNEETRKMAPRFWYAYAMEKLEREQTDCLAMPYEWLNRIYTDAALQTRLLPHLQDLRALIRTGRHSETRRNLLQHMGKQCPDSGARPAGTDPWKICQAKAEEMKRISAEQEEKAESSRRRSARKPEEPQCEAEIEMDVAADLGYREDTPHFATCKPLPSDPGKSIVALSFIRAGSEFDAQNEEMGEYDLDVLLIRSDSGKVLSRTRIEKAEASDAVRYTGLEIDFPPYELAPGVHASGVSTTQSSSSHASVWGETKWRMFVVGKGKLREVLSLQLSLRSGEVGYCSGSYETTERKLGAGTGQSHGLKNLIVTTRTTRTEFHPDGDECKETDLKPEISSVTLRYNGDRYVVPPGMK